MIRLLFVFIVFCITAACATQEVENKQESREQAIARYNATAKPEDQIVCTNTKADGGIYRSKVCTKRGSINAELSKSLKIVQRIPLNFFRCIPDVISHVDSMGVIDQLESSGRSLCKTGLLTEKTASYH